MSEERSGGKDEKFTPKFLKRQKNNWGVPAVIVAVGTCLIFSMFYWEQNGAFTDLIAASANSVFEKGEYWRLFTSVFAHGDLDHFLSNMLMLSFLTYFVTAFYGIAAALFAFLAGALINLGTLQWIGGDTALVGASGVVYYLWGFWLSLYVCIQKQLTLIGRFLRVGAIFLVLLIPTTYSPSTSYFAHYFGFVIGALAGTALYFFGSKRPSEDEIQEEMKVYKPSAHPQPWEGDFDWSNGQDEEGEEDEETSAEDPRL